MFSKNWLLTASKSLTASLTLSCDLPLHIIHLTKEIFSQAFLQLSSVFQQCWISFLKYTCSSSNYDLRVFNVCMYIRNCLLSSSENMEGLPVFFLFVFFAISFAMCLLPVFSNCCLPVINGAPLQVWKLIFKMPYRCSNSMRYRWKR